MGRLGTTCEGLDHADRTPSLTSPNKLAYREAWFAASAGMRRASDGLTRSRQAITKLSRIMASPDSVEKPAKCLPLQCCSLSRHGKVSAQRSFLLGPTFTLPTKPFILRSLPLVFIG